MLIEKQAEFVTAVGLNTYRRFHSITYSREIVTSRFPCISIDVDSSVAPEFGLSNTIKSVEK